MPLVASDIKALAIELFPRLSPIISFKSEITRSTWESSLETGKAVEFVSLCALAESANRLGLTVKVPLLFTDNPDLFYLRNIIHRHHGAQPGHEGATFNIPLQDRFKAALTPRIIIELPDTFYGVYREGFPIHLIQNRYLGRPEYLDRPDIIIIEGAIYVSDGVENELDFSYFSTFGNCNGTLRIKNDITIPIKSYKTDLSKILTVGIIECSVSKGRERAEDQLNRYLKTFASNPAPATLLVNGISKNCIAYDYNAIISLKNGDISKIKHELMSKMDMFIVKLLKISTDVQEYD